MFYLKCLLFTFINMLNPKNIISFYLISPLFYGITPPPPPSSKKESRCGSHTAESPPPPRRFDVCVCKVVLAGLQI